MGREGKDKEEAGPDPPAAEETSLVSGGKRHREESLPTVSRHRCWSYWNRVSNGLSVYKCKQEQGHSTPQLPAAWLGTNSALGFNVDTGNASIHADSSGSLT